MALKLLWKLSKWFKRTLVAWFLADSHTLLHLCHCCSPRSSKPPTTHNHRALLSSKQLQFCSLPLLDLFFHQFLSHVTHDQHRKCSLLTQPGDCTSSSLVLHSRGLVGEYIHGLVGEYIHPAASAEGSLWEESSPCHSLCGSTKNISFLYVLLYSYEV